MLILNVVLNYDLTFRVLGLEGEENTGMAAFLEFAMVISVAIVSLLFIKKPIDIIEDITNKYMNVLPEWNYTLFP